jgi:hypothetical protein
MHMALRCTSRYDLLTMSPTKEAPDKAAGEIQSLTSQQADIKRTGLKPLLDRLARIKVEVADEEARDGVEAAAPSGSKRAGPGVTPLPARVTGRRNGGPEAGGTGTTSPDAVFMPPISPLLTGGYTVRPAELGNKSEKQRPDGDCSRTAHAPHGGAYVSAVPTWSLPAAETNRKFRQVAPMPPEWRVRLAITSLMTSRRVR